MFILIIPFVNEIIQVTCVCGERKKTSVPYRCPPFFQKWESAASVGTTNHFCFQLKVSLTPQIREILPV